MSLMSQWGADRSPDWQTEAPYRLVEQLRGVGVFQIRDRETRAGAGAEPHLAGSEGNSGGLDLVFLGRDT